ncbi:MAG: hypothetical protein H6877_05760 [Rhodobiaceae bacterium]|nr:hypothetical protein [Rhodobiaceae bacterium]MCC0060159.1 hypothetical protein [Rhodobiaceae bacterium]
MVTISSNRNTKAVIALMLGAIVSACSSGGSGGGNNQVIRQKVETAPADLQLLCAGEAAKRRGADSSKVLPTGSSVIQPGLYSVQLNVNGTPSTCTIDDQGNIQSIT